MHKHEITSQFKQKSKQKKNNKKIYKKLGNFIVLNVVARMLMRLLSTLIFVGFHASRKKIMYIFTPHASALVTKCQQRMQIYIYIYQFNVNGTYNKMRKGPLPLELRAQLFVLSFNQSVFSLAILQFLDGQSERESRAEITHLDYSNPLSTN